MLDLARDTIYFKDMEGKFITVSESGARFFGAKSRQEMEGKSDFDYFPEEMAAKFLADEKALMSSGEALIDKLEPETYPMGANLFLNHQTAPPQRSR